MPHTDAFGQSNSQLMTCDTTDSEIWNSGGLNPLTVKEGLCVTNDNSRLTSKSRVMDFSLTFDAKIGSDSSIIFSLEPDFGKFLDLYIKPNSVDLAECVYTGVDVKCKSIFSEKINLSNDSFYHFEIRHQTGLTSVLIDNNLVKKIGGGVLFTTIQINFTDGIFFDNLLLEEIPIGTTNSQLNTISEELNNTNILFINNDEIWMIQPDGADLQNIKSSKGAGNFKISFDGKYLSYKVEKRLFIVDLKENLILPIWQNGLEVNEYAWTSDNHLLIYGFDADPVKIIELNVETGEQLEIYTISKQLGPSGFVVSEIYEISCSPKNRAFVLSVFGEVSSHKWVSRHILFDPDNERIELIPGFLGVWASDGTTIFIEDAIIEFPSLNIRENLDLKQNHLIVTDNGDIGVLAWINGSLTSEVSLSPDLNHYVYSNKGRITIESEEGGKFEITQGFDPIWQPMPGYLDSIDHKPTISSTNLVSNISTPVPSSAISTNTPILSETNENFILKEEDLENPTNIDAFPGFLGKMLIILGTSVILLLVFVIFIYPSTFHKFSSIIRSNNIFSQVHSKIEQFIKHNGIFSKLSLTKFFLYFLCLGLVLIIIGAIILFTNYPQEEFHTIISENKTALQSNTQESSNTLCEGVNLKNDTIYDVYQKIKNSQNQKGQSIDYSLFCGIYNLSYSPDGSKILMGAHFGYDSNWIVMYETKNGFPIWSERMHFSRLENLLWAPDGNFIGLFIGNGWNIVNANTGDLENFLPNSTRLDNWNGGIDQEIKYKWLQNNQIIRKITDAIQFVNPSTGEVINEIIIDDEIMATSNPGLKFSAPTYKFDWSPSGNQMISIGYNTSGPIILWDTQTGRIIWETKLEKTFPFLSVSWQSCGQWIVLHDFYEGQIFILDPQNGRLQNEFSYGSQININSNPCSPDGRMIIFTDNSNKTFQIINVNTGEKQSFPTMNELEINEYYWLPDGNIFVSLKHPDINSEFNNFWILNPINNYWVELGKEKSFSNPQISSLENTSTPLPNDSHVQNEITNNENHNLVLIPAGEFEMGCDPEHNGGFDCQQQALPLHTVNLDNYYIDKYEVTNAQYAECVKAGVCEESFLSEYYTDSAYSNHPVIGIAFDDAQTYCTWSGKRLPTEAEWEKAARGTTVRAFPWGDEFPNCTLANYSDNDGNPCSPELGYWGSPTAVGNHPEGISPYGVHDMAGNVSEWVSDYFGANYYLTSPYKNPQGPTIEDATKMYWVSGACRVNPVLRGGSHFSQIESITTAYRETVAEGGFHMYGIRCASDTEYPELTIETPEPINSCPGAPPQRLKVGMVAQVCTKSDSLRLRNSPGLDGEIIASVQTGALFEIIGGPECAGNNWSWWKVFLGNECEIGWLAEGGDDIDPYFLCPLD
jgi:formylglycine-generating enzyme required for sulfatase activity